MELNSDNVLKIALIAADKGSVYNFTNPLVNSSIIGSNTELIASTSQKQIRAKFQNDSYSTFCQYLEIRVHAETQKNRGNQKCNLESCNLSMTRIRNRSDITTDKYGNLFPPLSPAWPKSGVRRISSGIPTLYPATYEKEFRKSSKIRYFFNTKLNSETFLLLQKFFPRPTPSGNFSILSKTRKIAPSKSSFSKIFMILKKLKN